MNTSERKNRDEIILVLKYKLLQFMLAKKKALSLKLYLEKYFNNNYISN